MQWGFKTPACGAHSLWGHGLACGSGGCGHRGPGMVEEATALLRRTETRRRKRHRLTAVLETCPTHVKRRPRKVLVQCLPGSAHQQAPSLHEGGTHWHDVTQNERHAKVGCPCKTTGILAETRCERGMPPGTSSLPGSAKT